ncbi:MAG: hypothetical protein ABJC74_09050, partial [Gemmatimonadota bacterium]
MNRITTLALLLPCFVACHEAAESVTPNGASPEIRAAIQAGDEAWSRADIAGDTSAMRALYVEDMVSMQADTTDLVGRDAM